MMPYNTDYMQGSRGEKTSFYFQPQIDGYYRINNNLNMPFSKKPKFIHRFFTKLLLGWVWVDK